MVGKKGASRWKYPDASIVFCGENPRSSPQATVIFKVGISEDWEDMLVGGNKVNVVILVSIKSATRATEASRRRIRSLLIDFGTTKGKALHMKEV